MLTVPTVPLAHGSAVACVDKKNSSVLVFAIGSVSLITTVVIAGNITMGTCHQLIKSCFQIVCREGFKIFVGIISCIIIVSACTVECYTNLVTISRIVFRGVFGGITRIDRKYRNIEGREYDYEGQQKGYPSFCHIFHINLRFVF